MSDPSQPVSGEPGHGNPNERGSGLAGLRVLFPYARQVRWFLVASGAAALVSMLSGMAIPLVTQRIIDGPLVDGDLRQLAWLIVVVLALGAAEAGLILVRRLLVAGPVTSLEHRMRMDLYGLLQRLPVAFHDRWQSGQLLSRAVSDLTIIRRFLAFGGIFLVVNAITVAVGFVILFWLAPAFGFILLTTSVPLVLLSYRYERQFKVAARSAQDQGGDLATVVEESVLGIRVLKAFGRGPQLASRFIADARVLRTTELRKVHILAVLWAVLILLPELALAGMLAFGAFSVANGSMTIGTLVAGVTTMAFIRWPIDAMGWLLAEASNAASASQRFSEIFAWPGQQPASVIREPARPRALARPASGRLRLEGVRFGYPESTGEVLRGVDLDVEPGETVALVGVTGSGKTTLTALVPRLYDVTAGRITLDGVDIRELALHDLRRVIATAFEDPVLFSASVRENVALGAPWASDDDIAEALQVAHADGFVDALPWGVRTRIGEQGLSLSGGQRQRLALARAVVGKPAVLVLDDPLSALDVHTEAEVERALRRVLRNVTALVVAHRPSTVQLADRVALLSGGRIAALGTHSELLATDHRYRAVLSSLKAPEEVGAR
ncbi:MAG TPA: ABC transporter ATP-binding protein [Pseudonocardiaceae bacterium]|nr:ABC transporter ATP-binding protein [Pseudonocardiaceae bacterium]